MWVVGLMSGTSADATDVALVDWPEGAGARPFELLAYREFGYPESLQSEIHRLAAGELDGSEVLCELVRLDRVIADRCADAVLAVLEEAGASPSRVAGIASHGQTIAHHPEHGGSLQIGCPARLAERTGRPVIADFRRRDLAMGGEGAFTASAALVAPEPIDLEDADPRALRRLPGIGEQRAMDIARLRWERAGRGLRLSEVPGIGPKTERALEARGALSQPLLGE